MTKHSLTILLLHFSSIIFSQATIRDILKQRGSYAEITRQADQYFAAKHPGKSKSDLVSGEFRDGDYVKYERWKSYWRHQLNDDGTLGDPSAYRQKQNVAEKSSSLPFPPVTWTNISNENYITGQISLGRTTSLAFHPTDPNIFYVGAAIGGIWKTTDGGNTYVPLGDGLPFLAVSSIVVDANNPSTIYIAVSDHLWYGPPGIGVYKSTNGGATWAPTSLTFSFEQNIRIYWMEAAPGNPNKMYVATAAGLFMTNNGFTTHSQVNSLNVNDFKFHANSADTLFFGTGDGKFFRSTNGGSSFSEIIDFGNSEVKIFISESSPTKIGARSGSTIYISSNTGGSFPTAYSVPEGNMVFAFTPSSSSTLLGGNFEIFRSDNGGQNFTQISHWLGSGGLPLIHVDQRNMFYNPLLPNAVYFCNDGGVYRYDTNTSTFTDLSDGLVITQFYDIAVAQTNSNVVSGGSQDNGSMFRDANGVWDDFAPTGDGMNTIIDETDHNIRYWEYQLGGIHRWTNGSNTSIKPPGAGDGAWETPFKLNPTNLSHIVIAYDKVYESFNKGDTWTAISGVLDGGNDMEQMAIAPSNPNRMYVSRYNILFVKDIASNTWVQKSTPVNQPIVDIEVDFQDEDVVYIIYSGYSNGGKVFVSEDAGNTWKNLSANLPNVSFGALELYEDVDKGIFIGSDNGVYYGNAKSPGWTLYGALPNTRVLDLEIQYANQLLRAGTHGRGVLEAPINISPCDTDGDGVCDEFDLCPFLDDAIVGDPCDDGNPGTTGEIVSLSCNCEVVVSTITPCSAAGSPGTGADWINNVKLNNLNHSSGQTFYSDFRSQYAYLVEDETYTLEVSLNYSFPLDSVFAWIDYNKNGSFSANEKILAAKPNASHLSTVTFTVPDLSSFGPTTMRTRVSYAAAGNPCGNYFGEVEDYSVLLKEKCVADKTVDNVVYNNNNVVYLPVSNNIFSLNTTVQSGAIVIYDGGNSTTLQSGFEVQTGGVFMVFSGGCN